MTAKHPYNRYEYKQHITPHYVTITILYSMDFLTVPCFAVKSDVY